LSIATFITNFGDLAVLLPIAVAVLAWLLWSPDSRRLAAAWAVAVVFCGGTIALLKVYFSACPTGVIDSPSGHAALSILIYGGLALIVAERSKPLAVPAIATGLGLALAIAGSRLAIGAHDGVEVLIGLIIGSGTLVIFGTALLRNPVPIPTRSMLAVAAVLAIGLHGQEVHAEDLFRLVGGYLHSIGVIGCISL
jgi:membrane-associated phospholipid phosphatase